MNFEDLFYYTHVDCGPTNQINLVPIYPEATAELEDLLLSNRIEPSKISDFSHTISQNGTTIGALGFDEDGDQLVLHLFIGNQYMDKDHSPVIRHLLKQLDNISWYSTLVALAHPSNVAAIDALFRAGLKKERSLPGEDSRFTFDLS